MMLIIVVMCTSCSKEPTPEPIPIPPIPTTPPPTGVISSFVITDSTMPFHTAGSILKWLVTGTNAQTVVKINGVIVLFNGILDVGPLKQTTTFTLEVNNGQKAAVVCYVADSLSTLLWNKGKRLKLTKKDYGYYPNPVFQDSSVLDSEANERIYFNYDKTSKILLVSSNSQYNGPKFTVSSDLKSFSWRGLFYDVGLLDANILTVFFDEAKPNGTRLKWRYKYEYE